MKDNAWSCWSQIRKHVKCQTMVRGLYQCLKK